jgi:hypothetical protein
MERFNEHVIQAFRESLGQSLGSLEGVTRASGLEGLVVVNGILRINTTLCPLYQQGSLNESQLLVGGTIAESRVANKWNSFVLMSRDVLGVASEFGIGVDATLTYADLGVISTNPDESVDRGAIEHGWQQYRDAARYELPEELSTRFQRYSQIGSMPQFVRPSGESSNWTSEVEGRVVRQLAENQVTFSPRVSGLLGGINRRGRKILRSLVNDFGEPIATGLLLQYGKFDSITSDPGSLNLFFERGELLLNVSNLFPHGEYPRVDVKC